MIRRTRGKLGLAFKLSSDDFRTVAGRHRKRLNTPLDQHRYDTARLMFSRPYASALCRSAPFVLVHYGMLAESPSRPSTPEA
jgi:hypothetical protein